MDYVTIPAQTWTKISDPTTSILVIQPESPTSFQLCFGEPTGNQSGIIDTGFVLNSGCTNELWVYCDGVNVMKVGTP